MTDEEKFNDRREAIERINRGLKLAIQGVGKWPQAKIDSRVESTLSDAWCLVLLLSRSNPDASAMLQRIEDAKSKATGVQIEFMLDASPKIEAMIASSRTVEDEAGCQPPPQITQPVLLIVAAWCLVLALVEFHGIWVYQISRWGICAAMVFEASRMPGNFRWPLWVLAVIYNPIAPIHFDDGWTLVNWMSTAALLLCWILQNRTMIAARLGQ